MKLKYLDEFINLCYEKRAKQTETSWYDSGVRDVYSEGFLDGLEKGKRLAVKSLKEINLLSEKI